MKIKEITLLSEENYIKYKHLIPMLKDCFWWLKTPCFGNDRFISFINDTGDLCGAHHCNKYGGVRPFCIFDIETADPVFWQRAKKNSEF